MKFKSQGVLGEKGKEGMESSLHTLDPCLVLLVANLMGNGNMSKPALVVHQGSAQEGIHRVSFDVMSFTKWEVLRAKCKLGVEVFCHLELGSMGNPFHCPVMDHMILEDPQAMRYCQKVSDNFCGPRCSCAVGGDASKMVMLKTRPVGCKLSKEKVDPTYVVLCMGCGLCRGACKWGKQGGLLHIES